ncbi:hypothetical protein FRB96_006494 [Tulasnella sp. 330]|nr:hypothetical protein FRB96_006494 [Tulasnella sp. 330]
MVEGFVRQLISRIRRSKRLIHRFDDDNLESGSSSRSENEWPTNTLYYTSEEIQGEITICELMQNSGFADVVRGIWTPPKSGIKHEVIIKSWPLRPKPRQVGDKDAVLDASIVRMIREARTWLSLSHPNIMPIYGWKIEGPWGNNCPCIIMPYMTNGDLLSYLFKSKPIPSNAERMELLIQIAEALLYIHTPSRPKKSAKKKDSHAKISIVHGDIKASNVLISDDIPKRALLGDFGAARIADGPGGNSGLATSSQDGGTVGYKAPERYRKYGDDEGEYKPITASDVYSFGGLVLEVLSGIPPFQGMQRADYVVTIAILEKKMSPREEHPLIHPDAKVWDLMERCWTFDPESRPGMSEVLESLKVEHAFVTSHEDRLELRT